MDHTAFDTYVQNTMDSWHCPGVAIAIVKGDETIYQRAFGLRDVDEKLPLTVETRFALASVTKSFTAMSAALLVDDGRLEWDRPVCEYIPEFILDDPYATRHVTVRDMLSHRTGLPRHDSAAWRLDLSRAEFIKRMRHLKFSTTFRAAFQYNNLMYAATAYLVEKIAGQRWEEFVHERIFTPLGMQASNFQPEASVPGQLIAKGYRVDRNESGAFKSLVHMPFGQHTELSPGPAGALFSTLADLTQWLKVHLNTGRLGDLQLVSKENLKQMHTPQMLIPVEGFAQTLFNVSMLAYGMGWMMRPYEGGMLIDHGGNVEGHSLVVGFMPESGIGVAVLTNAASSHVPHILLRESIDRALGLPSKDWNAKFHGAFDPVLTAIGKRKQTASEDRRPDAPPSHAMDAFTGSYAAEGYPDFEVKKNGDQLVAGIVGSLEWSELRPYHYNVFEWHRPNWDGWSKLRFQVDDAGDIASVSIPMEPAVQDIVFTRKALVLDEATAVALAGEYDPGIKGLLFLIVLREGKIYWQEPGKAPAEAMPCSSTDHAVEFKVKRSRALFFRKDGKFTHLALKTPEATFEATKC